jgi:NADH-quinone oxidoreductase subunit E
MPTRRRRCLWRLSKERLGTEMSNDRKPDPFGNRPSADPLAYPANTAMEMARLGVEVAGEAARLWLIAMTGVMQAGMRMVRPEPEETGADHKAAFEAGASPSKKARATVETIAADYTKAARDALEVSRAAAVEMAQAVGAPVAIDRPKTPDDLKAISGIGPKLEKVLNDLGVWTFRQIASWNEEQIAWIDEQLGIEGRVARDRWIDQAAKLARSKNHKTKASKGGRAA